LLGIDSRNHQPISRPLRRTLFLGCIRSRHGQPLVSRLPPSLSWTGDASAEGWIAIRWWNCPTGPLWPWAHSAHSRGIQQDSRGKRPQWPEFPYLRRVLEWPRRRRLGWCRSAREL